MSALRALSLVLAFAAAIGLVFGTAGFTAMGPDRGFAVDVTNDASASLGHEPLTDEVHSGGSTAVVEYRDQFGSVLDEFDVDVSVRSHGPTDVAIESVDSPSPLDRGTAAAVNLTLRRDERETLSLRFGADGSGGVGVSLDRVREAPSSGDGVEHDGTVDEKPLLSASVEDGEVVVNDGGNDD